MLKRLVPFTHHHDALRARVGEFLEREVTPHYARWEAAGPVPREVWRKAGASGLLCRGVPTRYGGPGGDFLDSVVVIEEVSRRRLTGFMTFLQSDIVVPYIAQLGTEEQKSAYLPACVSAECLVAIAMTEPHGGSDLRGIRTTATRVADGYVLDGEKMHVSNGAGADLLIVAARTGGGGRDGISLFLVDGGVPGLRRTPLRKAGVRALDTAHVRFERCHIPAHGLLGAEGLGLVYLVRLLGLERLVIAIGAQATCATVVRELVSDCASRCTALGNVLDHQNTRFTVADLVSEMAVNQAFVDQCIAAHVAGDGDPRAFCIAKLRTTEALRRTALHAVQLRGARGVSAEAGERAAQDLLDACAQTVWGGTSEVMKEIIGRGCESWI